MSQAESRARIINGDALAVVEGLGHFDYLITDPPYATGGTSSMVHKDTVLQAREMIESVTQSLIYGVISRIKRAHEFSLWLMVDWRQVSYYSSLFRKMGLCRQSCIVWDKLSSSMSPLYHPRHEFVLFATNSALKDVGYLGPDIVTQKKVTSSSKMHAFEKPPELMEQLCRNFPKGRVIDPFCGSGALLEGAHRLGWDCVGVEIDTQLCAKTAHRLDNILL